MSVVIHQLVKRYGSRTAVSEISFRAEKGQITGFLGPNGAGKSTTMKIAAGYISATSGKIEVNGMDVAQHPLKTRQLIGYLPENNPLYTDMYAEEYLKFVGSVYRISGSKLKNRVEEAMQQTGLEPAKGKKIADLSKGYRQRVGLAQAIVHDPEVLILDEPLTGLDPNQLVEIRALIKKLGSEKTVIFSTHIMQEVEYLCDKVVVIHEGKIVADDSLSSLQTSNGTTLTAEFAAKVLTETLVLLPGVINITCLHNTVYRIEVEKEMDIREVLFRWAAEHNNPILGLKVEENKLESLFQQLTSAN